MQIEFHNRKKEERKTHVTQLSRPVRFERTTTTEETTAEGEKTYWFFVPDPIAAAKYILRRHETSNVVWSLSQKEVEAGESWLVRACGGTESSIRSSIKMSYFLP